MWSLCSTLATSLINMMDFKWSWFNSDMCIFFRFRSHHDTMWKNSFVCCIVQLCQQNICQTLTLINQIQWTDHKRNKKDKSPTIFHFFHSFLCSVFENSIYFSMANMVAPRNLKWNFNTIYRSRSEMFRIIIIIWLPGESTKHFLASNSHMNIDSKRLLFDINNSITE